MRDVGIPRPSSPSDAERCARRRMRVGVCRLLLVAIGSVGLIYMTFGGVAWRVPEWALHLLPWGQAYQTLALAWLMLGHISRWHRALGSVICTSLLSLACLWNLSCLFQLSASRTLPICALSLSLSVAPQLAFLFLWRWRGGCLLRWEPLGRDQHAPVQRGFSLRFVGLFLTTTCVFLALLRVGWSIRTETLATAAVAPGLWHANLVDLTYWNLGLVVGYLELCSSWLAVPIGLQILRPTWRGMVVLSACFLVTVVVAPMLAPLVLPANSSVPWNWDEAWMAYRESLFWQAECLVPLGIVFLLARGGGLRQQTISAPVGPGSRRLA